LHHKRKRPKNRRAGCLLCKPHKMNGIEKYSSKGYARKIDIQENDRKKEQLNEIKNNVGL